MIAVEPLFDQDHVEEVGDGVDHTVFIGALNFIRESTNEIADALPRGFDEGGPLFANEIGLKAGMKMRAPEKVALFLNR